MAALKPDVKAFIIQSLACYDTPSQVVEAVQKEFGIKITRQQAESHDPTKASGKTLAKKWIAMFSATRERFLTETRDIPIANKSYRLRVLDRMATKTEGLKNFSLTAQLIEQAAKEVGDAYTNKLKVESTGKDGGPLRTETVSLSPQEAAEAYKNSRLRMQIRGMFLCRSRSLSISTNRTTTPCLSGEWRGWSGSGKPLKYFQPFVSFIVLIRPSSSLTGA